MKFLFCLILILFLLPTLQAQGIVNNIILPDSMGGMNDGAFSCVYNEINNCIYVGGQDFVFVIDGATDQTIARIPVSGGRVTSMLWIPGENKIFCARYENAKVTVIDGASNTVITTITVGIYPVCLEYNSTDNVVYCANKHSRDITVIDVAANLAIDTWMFQDEPRDMAWNATDNDLWCVGGNAYFNYGGSAGSGGNADYSAIIWNATDNIIYYADRANDYVLIKYSNGGGGVVVGDQPTALVWNATGDKVYCANYGSNDVSVIDGATSTVIDTIAVGSAPFGLSWNSVDNKIYCLNSGSHDITVIDGATDTVITTVQIKNAYFNYSYSTYKPHLAINSQNNKIYFPQSTHREVRVIDGSSNEIIEDILLGAMPWALAWNATSNKLYSANRSWQGEYINYYQGSITIIDGVNQVPITTIPAGEGPGDVVWNSTNNTVYCANSGSDNVLVIDGVSDQVTDTIAVGGTPFDMLWNATSNKIYTANKTGNSVSIIDAVSNTLLNTVQTDTTPRALIWNSTNNKIYCANYGGNTVSVIDGFSNNLITTIAVGSDPVDLLWSATGNTIYCAHSGGISIIDGVMDTVITIVSIAGNPVYLSWNATNNKVYCNGAYTDISVIDGNSNQIINTIQPDGYVYDHFWNSSDNKLYAITAIYDNISNQVLRHLVAIDGGNDSLLTSLTLGRTIGGVYFNFIDIPWPGHFAADPLSNRIFVTEERESRIAVIDPTVSGFVTDPLTEIPGEFFLQQNYPNPFNPTTVIKFYLPKSNRVTLKIFNILGEEVATLISTSLPSGSHKYEWNASGMASGVYLCVMQAGEFMETRKMVLMR
jgi:YVTN family beta-propeller protein